MTLAHGLLGHAEDSAVIPIDLKQAELSQRDALLAICDLAEFWRCPNGETYATVLVRDHLEHLRVQGPAFRDWWLGELGRRYCIGDRPAAAGRQALNDALMSVEAQARYMGRTHLAPLRTAAHEGSIFIDIGNDAWSVAEISAEGWNTIERPPIPIIRSNRTASFPLPVRDNGFARLRSLLSHLDEETFILFVAWLLGALHPGGPFPILVLCGEAGSGKSSLARLAQSLTDPVSGDLLQPPANDRDLIAAARHNHVLAFDNLSGLKADLADSICRLSTGGEIGGRALFTNHDTASFSAIRPIIINGIPDLASRGDLADRSIVIRLGGPQRFMTERDLRREIDEVRPAIFGALLDAMAIGIKNLETTPTPDVRMADFARLIETAESALPWKPGQFLEAYKRNRTHAAASLVEGDVVAVAVLDLLVGRPGGWSGLMSELYAELSRDVALESKRSGDWPANSRWFSDRLRRATPPLRTMGIIVTDRRTTRGMQVNITKMDSSDTSYIATSREPDREQFRAANVADVAISPMCNADAQ